MTTARECAGQNMTTKTKCFSVWSLTIYKHLLILVYYQVYCTLEIFTVRCLFLPQTLLKSSRYDTIFLQSVIKKIPVVQFMQGEREREKKNQIYLLRLIILQEMLIWCKKFKLSKFYEIKKIKIIAFYLKLKSDLSVWVIRFVELL